MKKILTTLALLVSGFASLDYERRNQFYNGVDVVVYIVIIITFVT